MTDTVTWSGAEVKALDLAYDPIRLLRTAVQETSSKALRLHHKIIDGEKISAQEIDAAFMSLAANVSEIGNLWSEFNVAVGRVLEVVAEQLDRCRVCYQSRDGYISKAWRYPASLLEAKGGLCANCENVAIDIDDVPF